MFKDGLCKEINQLGNQGWHTLESDDWVYYPQQYGKFRMSNNFTCP